MIGVDEDIALECRPGPSVGVGTKYEIVGDIARVKRTDRSKRIVVTALIPQQELWGQVGGLVLVDDETVLFAAEACRGAAINPAQGVGADDTAKGNSHKQSHQKEDLAHSCPPDMELRGARGCGPPSGDKVGRSGYFFRRVKAVPDGTDSPACFFPPYPPAS